MKLKTEQKVNATIIGTNGRLSTLGAFQVVENALTELTGELKIDGITEKEKYNAIWVFVKTRIKFFSSILWNEKLSVTSFISFKSLAKINFDVEAKNAVGELVFYARVEACALDIATMRIRKLVSVGVDETMQAETPTMDVEFANANYTNFEKKETIRVRSTNIDMSHHTNNLEYIRFILNTYSVSELETKIVKEMEVVYVNQSFENDELDVLKLSEQNKDVIYLQKENKPIIKCEILF